MKNFKKMPLTTIIVTIGFVLLLFAAIGSDNAYKKYMDGKNFLIKPFISVTMEGLHDGLFPWSRIEDDNNGAPQNITVSSGAIQSGAATDALQSGAIGIAASGAEAVSGAVEVPENSSGVSSVGTLNAPAVSQNTQADGAASYDPATDSALQVSADFTMPDGVCSAVVPAIDYGNTNPGFLAPAGTVFSYISGDPVFSPNGQYYKLQSVDESYFDDALFIGDSRTDGLRKFSDLKGHADFLAMDGLSVFKIYETQIPFVTPAGDQGKMGFEQCLQAKQYKKIYFSCGINELGMPTTITYYNKFKACIETIRKYQPDAIIYIQAIMHLSEEKVKNDQAFTNTNVVERNTAISKLANGHDIFYIDMNSAVCDENGNLRADETKEGAHLLAKDYVIWRDFLLNNAIVK